MTDSTIASPSLNLTPDITQATVFADGPAIMAWYASNDTTGYSTNNVEVTGGYVLAATQNGIFQGFII